MYVLIVESDEQRRHDLIGGLEASGYATLAAAGVDQAEALAQECQIALAICGVDLVIGAGSFLAAALRRVNTTVLYTELEFLAPAGLRTFWVHRGTPVPSVVRVVEKLHPPRPNTELSSM
jgi:CheY-like chemotaxis protein